MIIRQTPNTLIIGHFPMIPWIVVICFIIGTFAGAVTSFRNHDRISAYSALSVFLISMFITKFLYTGYFVFNRSERKLIWHHKGIYSDKKGEICFDEIQDVILQGERDSDNDELIYLIIIETKTDKICITNEYFCREKAEEVRDAVRKILQ